MNINVNITDNECCIAVEGKIDTTTSPEFEEAVFLNMGNAENLVIDMLNTSYITSTGMRVILKASNTMRNHGNFRIINVSPAVYEVMRLANFHKFINITKVGEDSEPISQVQKTDVTFSRYMLSMEDESKLPVTLKPALQESEAKIYALTDSNEKMQMFSLVDDRDEEELNILYSYFANGYSKEDGIKAMMRGLKESYTSLNSLTITFYGNPEDNEEFKAIADHIALQSKGVTGAYFKYNMNSILDSNVYKNLDKLSTMTDSIRKLDELDDMALFDLQLSNDLDTDLMDADFCRFNETDGEISGILDGVRIDPKQVIIKDFSINEAPDHVIPLMLASFLQTFMEEMPEDAELYIVCTKKDNLQGITTSLGKPDQETLFYTYKA